LLDGADRWGRAHIASLSFHSVINLRLALENSKGLAVYEVTHLDSLPPSYSVFQEFSKAKSANGGSILSSSQFLILPQLPQKIKLASKVVKIDSKIIISLPKI
jgi:hypothetical protein